MVYAIIVMQWLHVFLGVFWFGSTLYFNTVVIPAILKLPPEQSIAASKSFAEQSPRVVTPVAVLAILLGLLRGTVFGPVQSLGFLFGTAYGITFLVSFLAATGTYLWGALVLVREAEKLQVLPTNAKEQAEYDATMNRAKIIGLLELVGFLGVFTCMILMRFGY